MTSISGSNVVSAADPPISLTVLQVVQVAAVTTDAAREPRSSRP